MIDFRPHVFPTLRGMLLDVEGTLSSIQFVHDCMFPYVREHVASFLEENSSNDEVRAVSYQVVGEAGQSTLPDATCDLSDAKIRSIVIQAVMSLMDEDAKVTGLKQLQGLIWKEAFHSGQLRAHVFDDVLPFLQECRERRISVRIYSSGSIGAQRLFFGHTLVGDLLTFFAGHYDTTTGSKKEKDSYGRIIRDFQLEPAEVLFVSDSVAELDAAHAAGLRTMLCDRPGNPTPPTHHHHPGWRGSLTGILEDLVSSKGAATSSPRRIDARLHPNG